MVLFMKSIWFKHQEPRITVIIEQLYELLVEQLCTEELENNFIETEYAYNKYNSQIIVKQS